MSDEKKKAVLPKLLQYAQTIVDSLQQQRYLEYACSVAGKIQSYPDLYRDYVSSDLPAIQLDQKVTAAVMGAGESGESVAALLHQGPYARFQQDVQGMGPPIIEQSARGTVPQVQKIQALQMGPSSLSDVLIDEGFGGSWIHHFEDPDDFQDAISIGDDFAIRYLPGWME